ncbi:MAG: type II secretion system F family protein [Deltaproteobacteria bacterium]|nr:type II secretion system F family protein [Deltaproteobacteria bacterium]
MSAPGKLGGVVNALKNGDSQALKHLILFVVFATIAYAVTQSIHSPKGLLRRFASGYVAKIDAAQKSMFLPTTGTKIAWTQLVIIFVIVSIFGVVPQGFLLLVAVGVAVVPPISIRWELAKRRARIDDQAHGFALSLANALKATASIGDAMRGATDVTAAPLKQELQTVLRQVGVGSTMEEALLALSTRVQSPALDVVVSALLIGRQTGGDLPRILENTASSLRDLKRLEALTHKVTRSAKQSLAVSASVTCGIAVMLPRLFPGFLDPLKDTVKGQIYAGQMIVVFLVALYLGYRFTRTSV